MADRLIANSCVAPAPLWSAGYWHAGEPCWLWLKQRDRYGYGRLSRRLTKGPRKGQPVNFGAHRVSVRTFTGRYLNSKTPVMHACNNRECINPAHLSGGTFRKNNRQTVRDGNHWSGARGSKAAYRESLASDFEVIA